MKTLATSGLAAVGGLLLWLIPPLNAAEQTADDFLRAYLKNETARSAVQSRARMDSREVWERERESLRTELAEMLGLFPPPPRTDLRPVVTGVLEREEIAVEKLHFQSLPGLYVTANLYRPRVVEKPLPTILYVSGHADVRSGEISFGNKTHYQHHAIWFARHGYVCLVLDTIQLGEIRGLHHGTYREGMWWWNSLGYTPAGVEAWNSMRALDYLETRPEVDADRIGMTGRSGGGSYTWTTAALDSRIKVAAPVAGIADLQNHVIDGCVEGHCDCMFWVNTYQWDFPLNAALIAPRPLLIVNTDSDPIFPLDGVLRVHDEVRRVYAFSNQPERLGLVIAPGGHQDTQDLQVPVFRWFNRHLQGEDPAISVAAEKLFSPSELRVFASGLPADQINTHIYERFVERRSSEGVGEPLLAELRDQVFRAWPRLPEPVIFRTVRLAEGEGVQMIHFKLESQEFVPLDLFVARPVLDRPGAVLLNLLDDPEWERQRSFLSGQWTDPDMGLPEEILAQVRERKHLVAWFAPRGIGPGSWTGDSRTQIHLRRRFMLLGQTVDGMRVWDIRRALEALRQMTAEASPITLQAGGKMAVNALYASLFESSPPDLDLSRFPETLRDGPDYLNAARVAEISVLLEWARSRGAVRAGK